MKKRSITIFAIATILFVPILAFAQVAGAQAENSKLKNILSKKGDSQVYVVLMDLDPAISYEGGVPGLRATKPQKGKKLSAMVTGNINLVIKKYKHLTEALRHIDNFLTK